MTSDVHSLYSGWHRWVVGLTVLTTQDSFIHSFTEHSNNPRLVMQPWDIEFVTNTHSSHIVSVLYGAVK